MKDEGEKGKEGREKEEGKGGKEGEEVRNGRGAAAKGRGKREKGEESVLGRLGFSRNWFCVLAQRIWKAMCTKGFGTAYLCQHSPTTRRKRKKKIKWRGKERRRTRERKEDRLLTRD